MIYEPKERRVIIREYIGLIMPNILADQYQYTKRKLGIKYYVRYSDEILIQRSEK